MQNDRFDSDSEEPKGLNIYDYTDSDKNDPNLKSRLKSLKLQYKE